MKRGRQRSSAARSGVVALASAALLSCGGSGMTSPPPAADVEASTSAERQLADARAANDAAGWAAAWRQLAAESGPLPLPVDDPTFAAASFAELLRADSADAILALQASAPLPSDLTSRVLSRVDTYLFEVTRQSRGRATPAAIASFRAVLEGPGAGALLERHSAIAALARDPSEPAVPLGSLTDGELNVGRALADELRARGLAGAAAATFEYIARQPSGEVRALLRDAAACLFEDGRPDDAFAAIERSLAGGSRVANDAPTDAVHRDGADPIALTPDDIGAAYSVVVQAGFGGRAPGGLAPFRDAECSPALQPLITEAALVELRAAIAAQDIDRAADYLVQRVDEGCAVDTLAPVGGVLLFESQHRDAADPLLAVAVQRRPTAAVLAGYLAPRITHGEPDSDRVAVAAAALDALVASGAELSAGDAVALAEMEWREYFEDSIDALLSRAGAAHAGDVALAVRRADRASERDGDDARATEILRGLLAAADDPVAAGEAAYVSLSELRLRDLAATVAGWVADDPRAAGRDRDGSGRDATDRALLAIATLRAGARGTDAADALRLFVTRAERTRGDWYEVWTNAATDVDAGADPSWVAWLAEASLAAGYATPNVWVRGAQARVALGESREVEREIAALVSSAPDEVAAVGRAAATSSAAGVLLAGLARGAMDTDDERVELALVEALVVAATGGASPSGLIHDPDLVLHSARRALREGGAPAALPAPSRLWPVSPEAAAFVAGERALADPSAANLLLWVNYAETSEDDPDRARLIAALLGRVQELTRDQQDEAVSHLTPLDACAAAAIAAVGGVDTGRRDVVNETLRRLGSAVACGAPDYLRRIDATAVQPLAAELRAVARAPARPTGFDADGALAVANELDSAAAAAAAALGENARALERWAAIGGPTPSDANVLLDAVLATAEPSRPDATLDRLGAAWGGTLTAEGWRRVASTLRSEGRTDLASAAWRRGAALDAGDWSVAAYGSIAAIGAGDDAALAVAELTRTLRGALESGAAIGAAVSDAQAALVAIGRRDLALSMLDGVDRSAFASDRAKLLASLGTDDPRRALESAAVSPYERIATLFELGDPAHAVASWERAASQLRPAEHAALVDDHWMELGAYAADALARDAIVAQAALDRRVSGANAVARVALARGVDSAAVAALDAAAHDSPDAASMRAAARVLLAPTVAARARALRDPTLSPAVALRMAHELADLDADPGGPASEPSAARRAIWASASGRSDLALSLVESALAESHACLELRSWAHHRSGSAGSELLDALDSVSSQGLAVELHDALERTAAQGSCPAAWLAAAAVASFEHSPTRDADLAAWDRMSGGRPVPDGVAQALGISAGPPGDGVADRVQRAMEAGDLDAARALAREATAGLEPVERFRLAYTVGELGVAREAVSQGRQRLGALGLLETIRGLVDDALDPALAQDVDVSLLELGPREAVCQRFVVERARLAARGILGDGVDAVAALGQPADGPAFDASRAAALCARPIDDAAQAARVAALLDAGEVQTGAELADELTASPAPAALAVRVRVAALRADANAGTLADVAARELAPERSDELVEALLRDGSCDAAWTVARGVQRPTPTMRSLRVSAAACAGTAGELAAAVQELIGCGSEEPGQPCSAPRVGRDAADAVAALARAGQLELAFEIAVAMAETPPQIGYFADTDGAYPAVAALAAVDPGAARRFLETHLPLWLVAPRELGVADIVVPMLDLDAAPDAPPLRWRIPFDAASLSRRSLESALGSGARESNPEAWAARVRRAGADSGRWEAVLSSAPQAAARALDAAVSGSTSDAARWLDVARRVCASAVDGECGVDAGVFDAIDNLIRERAAAAQSAAPRARGGRRSRR
ncbi:MAG: hypothetical protein H6698_03515 [Myxococcales bacterium]|nr:hypothetical protein [Myxococcales bacterium]